MNVNYTGAEFLKAFLNSCIDSMGTGYVMRSKDYDELGGIGVKYPNLLFADFELWIQLANKSFVAIDSKNCFAFRLHQSTTHHSQDKKLHTALEIFVDFLVELKNVDEKMARVIDEYGNRFLLYYCKSYAHRMLRSTLKMRNGLTIQQFIQHTKLMAKKLGHFDSYRPEKKTTIQLAKMIDNSNLLRFLFLSLKKIYSKPLL